MQKVLIDRKVKADVLERAEYILVLKYEDRKYINNITD